MSFIQWIVPVIILLIMVSAVFLGLFIHQKNWIRSDLKASGIFITAFIDNGSTILQYKDMILKIEGFQNGLIH